MAALLAERIRVIAFEPQAQCCATLTQRFGSDPHFVLEDCVVSNHDGESRLFVPSAHTIASTNPEWIAAVQASQRFGRQEWSAVTRVRSVTLDQAIDTYGVPAFCKIDVEGAEHEVLQGLSSPVPLIAFEHTPEYPRSTIDSIACLSSLGPYEWNYSRGESAELLADQWLSQSDLEATLTQLPLSGFGDVYARLQGSSKGRGKLSCVFI